MERYIHQLNKAEPLHIAWDFKNIDFPETATLTERTLKILPLTPPKVDFDFLPSTLKTKRTSCSKLVEIIIS
jgi:hypothetical protein